MEDEQTKVSSNKKRNLQQISVPFLWEEKPGVAKKQWEAAPAEALRPSRLPPPPPPPPPAAGAKFVVSVPFKWEEKPGTPIRTFAEDPSLAHKNKSLPLPPAYYSQFYECFDSDEESSFEDDDEDDDPDWLMLLDQDAGSKNSAPSLLSNRIIPAAAISSAVPFSSSPDSTGSGSPVGNSFLEQLFPLYTPKADPPGKPHAPAADRSLAIRRPQTLGELIMLSRRRSHLHTSVSKNEQEFDPPNAHGCCMFRSGNAAPIPKFLGGKTLLTLKFA